MRRILTLPQIIFKHRYGFTLFAFLAAATVTGPACVLFMRAFEVADRNRLDMTSVGHWSWLTTPLLFLISIELIRRIAPCAEGSGIQQAVFAAKHLNSKTEKVLSPLISFRTLAVKTAAILIGVWAGASMGREGPTVHVATCMFVGMLLLFRRWTGIQFDFRSAIIAGGAAGLAAAFNTPLAGVTFAIEELSEDYFSHIKDFVMMAIIIAAIAAKHMTGEYAYFGRLSEPPSLPLLTIVLVGVVGGLLGAFFSSALVTGRNMVARYQSGWARYLLPVLLAWGVLSTAALGWPNTLGPGNLAAQDLLRGHYEKLTAFFPFAKMAATLMSYWSGIAGGIFAPSLSIGSAMGAAVGHWMRVPIAACALIGMAAFLSGTIQAPITSFVIIFEMSGQHQMLLPIMLASMLAFMVARVLGTKHLYQALAANYQYLLVPEMASPENRSRHGGIEP